MNFETLMQAEIYLKKAKLYNCEVLSEENGFGIYYFTNNRTWRYRLELDRKFHSY